MLPAGHRSPGSRELCSIDSEGNISDAHLHEPILNGISREAEERLLEATRKRAEQRSQGGSDTEPLPSAPDAISGALGKCSSTGEGFMSVIRGPWPQRCEVLLNQQDAELLRIGVELDQVDVDRRALLEAEARRRAAQEAACRAIGLTPPADVRDTRAWQSTSVGATWCPTTGRTQISPTAMSAALPSEYARSESIAASSIDNRQLDLLGRAATITATTVYGLRVQLRALGLAMKEEFDYEAHKLLAAAMAFAGGEPAPEYGPSDAA